MKASRRAFASLLLAAGLLATLQCRHEPDPILPPSAPAAPTLSPGNGEIAVNWAAVDSATEYNVLYSTTNSTSTAIRFGGDYTGTRTTITGLTNGTRYYVWIIAKNEAGRSPYSPSASAIPVPDAPEAPEAPTLTPGDGQIGVSWTSVSGATAYNVFYSTTNNSAAAAQFGGDYTITSTTITKLINGTPYYVWLKTKNAGGSSGFSLVSSATPMLTVPGVPSAPTLTPGDGQIGVSWTLVSGATAYNVFYNTTNSSATAAQFGGDYTGTSATITGLVNGTPHYVWLKAKNATGSSGFSPVSSATPLPPAPGAPDAPTLIPGNAQIGVSWTAVSGATAYNVYRNTTNNSGTATKFGTDYTGTSMTITGLTNGMHYYVWLKAKNLGGTSGFSPPSDCWLTPNAPAAPTLTPGDTQIGVSWTAVSGASSYNVFCYTSNIPGSATQFPGDYTGTTATITGLTNDTPYFVWIKAKNAGGTSGFSPSASSTPRLPYAALSAAGVTLSQFNGKYIYTIVSPQPASKPEGEGTPSTKYSYTLSSVVGSMIAPTPSARPSREPDRPPAIPYSAKQMEMDLRMREAEQKALASKARQLSKTLPALDAAAPTPINIGTAWNGVYLYSAPPFTIDTTCRYISSHAYFFVDNRNISAMESYLAGYGTSFDAIYDTNHTHFGTENDVDANGKVIIVFSQDLAAGWLGYFWSVDKYPKSYNSYSNEGDIFYVTTNPSYQGNYVNGTLAHEFQHMIYFDEHYNRGGSGSTWLNEALSQAAEFYNNYVYNHEGWIRSFLYSGWSTGLSLTYWTSSNYGYGAIYIRYLIDQYGDSAIKNMCATYKAGVASVEAATLADFNTIFNNFTRALVLSGTGDSVDPKYNFATLNLQTVQTSGRGGLLITASNAAGSPVSGSLSAYSLAASRWTGSFGSMMLSGTDVAGSAFGLLR